MTARPSKVSEAVRLAANPQAERAYLACLMRHPDARLIVENQISADHFQGEATREAFEAITGFIADGTPPDAATLRKAVADATRIELETSLSENASAANAHVYAKLLKEAKAARDEQAAIQRVQAAILSGASLDEIRVLAAEQAAKLPPKTGPKPPQTRFTAAELLRMEFPDPEWLLPDVLPETGLYLLCGKPKAGKSWFALAVAMALAQGGAFLNRDTPRRKVLYLALEDTPRRLNSRLETLHPYGSPDDLADLEIRTAAPKLGKGLEEQIRQAAADGCDVLFLDTLQKIRPPSSKNGTQYADDYAVLSAIKQIADDCGICIVVVHHTRKAESLDDPHDDISGTNGIAGAADGSLIIRRVHGKPDAVLHVTGRDLPDNELGLRFEDGLWTFAGTAAEVRTTAEQAEIIDAIKPYGSEGATVKTICADTGKQRRNVAKLLGKLVDAKRVRVRRAKPADFFAVCDGPMSGDTTGSMHHASSNRERGEREGGDNEKHKLSSTGSTGSIGTNSSTGTMPKPEGGTGGTAGTDTHSAPFAKTDSKGGTAGTAGTLVEREADRPGSRSNTGLAGNGGTGGTGGTQNSVELRAQGWEPAQWRNGETDDLAVELATLANLDVGHMLEGRLVTDSEWSGFAGGLAKLNERHPDKAAEIAALVDRVNVAAEALEGAP